jgi:hypothetical protein
MKNPNWSAMISDCARMITELLESSSPEAQAAISKAISGGAELSVRMAVLPQPCLTVELEEREGKRHTLATVPLHRRDELPKKH